MKSSYDNDISYKVNGIVFLNSNVHMQGIIILATKWGEIVSSKWNQFNF